MTFKQSFVVRRLNSGVCLDETGHEATLFQGYRCTSIGSGCGGVERKGGTLVRKSESELDIEKEQAVLVEEA